MQRFQKDFRQIVWVGVSMCRYDYVLRLKYDQTTCRQQVLTVWHGLMPGQVWFALMILMMCDVCHLFSAASSFIDSESFFTFFGFLPESWKKTNCHRLELQPLRRKSGANWLLQWHKDIFPESSCECFFPNNCCQIHLFIFIYTTSPTSFTPPTSST